jgi:hypothetical protein
MRTARSRWSVLIWAVFIAACSRYTVQQTSLVPAAVIAPAPASQQGADFALLGSYLTTFGARDWYSDSSLWVARGQAVGTFEYAFAGGSVRATAFGGPSAGAVRAQANTFDSPRRATWGGGPGGLLRFMRADPNDDLALTGDLWLADSPSRIDSNCNDSCTFASGGGRRIDRSAAFMFNSGLQYRHLFLRQLHLTLGAGLQTLVTNDAVREDSRLGGRSKVRMGAPHPLFDLGLEWLPAPWFGLSPVLAWAAPPTPLLYGPTVALVVRLHVARERASAADHSPSAK